MPVYLPTNGPDPLINYTAKEIETMYLNEGKLKSWARRQSRIIARAINTLNKTEQRMYANQQEEPPALLLDT